MPVLEGAGRVSVADFPFIVSCFLERIAPDTSAMAIW
jgi:hypothetical protein